MIMSADFSRVAAQEVAKTAPAAAVAGATLLGLGLQDWVYVTAILYAVLQSAFLVFKWVHELRPVPKPKPTVPPSSGS